MHDSTWVATRADASSGLARLICLPFAGGGAGAFAAWSRHAPPWLNVAPVRLPGRDGRAQEPAFTRMEPLVDALTEGLAAWLKPPYVLYGHSLGALVALHLADTLARRGLPLPTLLAVGACRPPPGHAPGPPLHGLDERALLGELQRRYGGIPQAIAESPELRRLFLGPLRADLCILERLTGPLPDPLPTPLLGFAGEDDPLVRPEHIEGWGRFSVHDLDVRVVPGGHFFCREAAASQVVNELVDELGHCLSVKG